LIIALVAFVILIPIASLPKQFLAELLWGTTETSYQLFFRPLPFWAAFFSLLFPITIAFAELPTYFGLVMPRLEKQLDNGWLAWAICSFFLALQHIALPLIIDERFVIWRFGMFIPFAFFVGLCLKLRPRLFPYFMIGHAIIDLTVVIMIINL
jgi:membrane protease YdiL (CAAX protease family)